jgi:hypothetical protein
MSIEIRSTAPGPVIRSGSIPSRGFEGGKAPFMTMSSRTVEAPKIGISFPTPGEKPSYMSNSRAYEAKPPVFTIEKAQVRFAADPQFSRVMEQRQQKVEALQARKLITRPVTETARKHDKTFAQALAEKQSKQTPDIQSRRQNPDHGFYGLTLHPERVQTPRINGTAQSEKEGAVGNMAEVRVESIIVPDAKRGMTQEVAHDTLKKYAHAKPAERILNSDIKQAFAKVIEPAHSPLTSSVASLWLDKEQKHPAPGADEEATRFLKDLIEEHPTLQGKLEAQLKIATVIMANYVAIGYPESLARVVVLQNIEANIRKEVKKVLKRKIEEATLQDETDKNEQEKTDKLPVSESERTFMRAENVNNRRIQELNYLAKMLSTEDPQTNRKVVYPKKVAHIWKLTRDNVSPILKDESGEQKRIDGSWGEIIQEMSGWETISLDEFADRVRVLVFHKTAVAFGKNPYATHEDVRRVVTVPEEYTMLRLSKQNQGLKLAA